ncbi:hypothetical protein PAEPH01_1793 [Pancytospora epiphaga]|nr:hypothetical protein PAEPH01_1793 [Pancytospora epiphaga]
MTNFMFTYLLFLCFLLLFFILFYYFHFKINSSLLNRLALLFSIDFGTHKMETQNDIKPKNEVLGVINDTSEKSSDPCAIKKIDAIEHKSVFVRTKETLHRIFSSIRDGFRRAFHWLKSKFTPRDDESDI